MVMENLEDFKKTVSENLVRHRRNSGLTQLDIAKKLNYSDKAVSKWERGETVPDAYILKQLAEIYQISIDDLISKKDEHKRVSTNLKKSFKHKRFLIICLSAGLVWLFACICFVVLSFTSLKNNAWLSFIYAIPASSIVCLVLCSIWTRKWVGGIFATITIWTTFLCIYLTVSNPRLWLIFIIAIPIQILVILWYFLIKENKKIKNHIKNNDEVKTSNQENIEKEDH